MPVKPSRSNQYHLYVHCMCMHNNNIIKYLHLSKIMYINPSSNSLVWGLLRLTLIMSISYGVSLLQAGLCSQETCGNLREAALTLLAVPNEKNPDKLSLAFEPECAAIYCQNMSEQLVAPYCQVEKPFQSMCYISCS